MKPRAWTTRIAALFIGLTFANQALADKDRDFRRGRPRWTGNERSERVRDARAGQASFAGNGCPQGTMQVSFAPDFLSFSILFDQFVAELTPENRQRRDVMNCEALIPMEIPEGMQMEITRVDFRGFVALPEGTRANLNSVFSFKTRDRNRRFGGDGSRINLRYAFEGPVIDNYEISTDVLNDSGRPAAQTEVSPCGGSVRLRVMNQLKIVAPRKGVTEASTVTIDSIDGTANAVYYVSWRSCRP